MNDCVLWDKSLSSTGYGNAWRNGKPLGAHRYTWEQQRGPIPDGLYVLHHCDNRACVNIDHLYVGTQSDNIRDAVRRGRHKSGPGSEPRSHCYHGHEFTVDNTYIRPDGWKSCRTCRRTWEKLHRKRPRVQRVAHV